jgi:hypothetical protein
MDTNGPISCFRLMFRHLLLLFTSSSYQHIESFPCIYFPGPLFFFLPPSLYQTIISLGSSFFCNLTVLSLACSGTTRTGPAAQAFQQVTFRCNPYTQGPQHHRGREPSLQTFRDTCVLHAERWNKHFLLQYTLWHGCCFVNKNILLSRSPSKTRRVHNERSFRIVLQHLQLHAIDIFKFDRDFVNPALVMRTEKETRTHNG